ncbi:MAG TPA: GTPase HflX [Gemmatimonadota bacterium]|nr:GTPase HflX [Gemmatimonadota bacterium]
MIDVKEPDERALLVGAPPLERPRELVDEHLAELTRLAHTAGAAVVGALVQRLESPHPATYIGSGKLDELRRMARERGASLAIFDEDLSPAQGSAIEEHIGVRVMDRTELILDIFALRARTSEAKLQVELAQLQYMRPRLKRMWTHLSRTAGGIGARGPGEQQLETDRRLIDRRISRLGGQLKEIAKSRDTQRKGRREAFQVALVGYTNAGKSSILRGLSGSDLFVEDRLFATLDSATRSVDLGEGYEALVTDTVGFIRKLPHHLVASFRATLEEVQEADLLLHVIDASAPNWEHQAEAVNGVLRDMDTHGGSVLLVFHKVDRLDEERQRALHERSTALLGPHVLTTVEESGGLEALRDVIRARIRSRRPTVRLVLSAGDGRTLAEAYREGEVLSREQNGTEIVITARVPEALVGRWEGQEGLRVDRQDAA